MAESDYVKLIADGLKAYHDAGYMKTFDKNIAENNPNGFDMQQFYNMIAWSGLQNTKAYNSKDAAWKTVFNDQCNTARTNDAATCK